MPALDPLQEARLLAAFVDALIPGDGEFPSAATLGIQGVTAARLRERLGPEAPGRLAALLADAMVAAGDLVSGMRAVEQAEPELFGLALTAAYLAYYESPAVIRVLRALGHDYNDAPQPQGYAMAPFDPALDAPQHGRGRWIATEHVQRLVWPAAGEER
jgi:hypothetical protein